MIKEIYLNDLSEGLREATIREWYVKENQVITKGEPLVAFETAKAIMEAPAPYSGTVHQLHHQQPGDKITPDDVLLMIETV